MAGKPWHLEDTVSDIWYRSNVTSHLLAIFPRVK